MRFRGRKKNVSGLVVQLPNTGDEMHQSMAGGLSATLMIHGIDLVMWISWQRAWRPPGVLDWDRHIVILFAVWCPKDCHCWEGRLQPFSDQKVSKLELVKSFKFRKGLWNWFCLWCLLLVWPWVSHLTSFGLCFFTCKMKKSTSLWSPFQLDTFDPLIS